jgi:hypothetical protein
MDSIIGSIKIQMKHCLTVDEASFAVQGLPNRYLAVIAP